MIPTPTPPAAPRYVVALDPGTRHAGIAIAMADVSGAPGHIVGAVDLRTNRADVAAMVDEVALALAETDPAAHVLVSEWPRKYRTSKAAWADLDGLREVVRRVEAWGWARTVRVAPGTWKGQVPKHIHHARVAAALGADAIRLGWAGLGPDARDAVALARWALGPGRARVFPPTPTPEVT